MVNKVLEYLLTQALEFGETERPLKVSAPSSLGLCWVHADDEHLAELVSLLTHAKPAWANRRKWTERLRNCTEVRIRIIFR